MAWFRLDDQVTFHQKTLDAGNEAFGAWVRMGTWSSSRGLNGLVTKGAALTIAGRQEIIDDLLRVGYLESRENGDYYVHDYLDWNPSADEVERKRQARVAAGQRGGKLSADKRSEAKSKQTAKQLLEQNPSKGSSKTEANGQAKSNPVPVPVPVPSASYEAEIRSRFVDAWKLKTRKVISNPSHMLEAANLVVDASRLHGRPPEDYMDAFLAWVDSCPPDRKPSIAPHKFVEHFDRIQEFIIGGKKPAQTKPNRPPIFTGNVFKDSE